MNNAFTTQFGDHLHGIYSCFDRVIVRGYIHHLFCEGGLIRFLRAAGFRKFTNGVMRIFTDQLNAYVEKIAKREGIDILWWPSVDGGRNGARSRSMWKSNLCGRMTGGKATSSTASSRTWNGHNHLLHARWRRRTAIV
ncbi:hypothetical protein K8I28_00685 [bacterium]|nr:hypothetical protein [bacterium]